EPAEIRDRFTVHVLFDRAGHQVEWGEVLDTLDADRHVRVGDPADALQEDLALNHQPEARVASVALDQDQLAVDLGDLELLLLTAGDEALVQAVEPARCQLLGLAVAVRLRLQHDASVRDNLYIDGRRLRLEGQDLLLFLLLSHVTSSDVSMWDP